MQNYGIVHEYKHNQNKRHHDDRTFKDEFQNDVYEKAREYFEKYNMSNVLDIGTGSGYKLNKYFLNDDTTGLDIEPTLTYLKETYPNKKWEESDFNKKMGSFDIIICADVIEHIENPDVLLNFINSIDFKYCILSTPERDSWEMHVYKKLICGPPRNSCHWREWNFSEFKNYISDKFNILEHYKGDFPSQNMVITKK